MNAITFSGRINAALQTYQKLGQRNPLGNLVWVNKNINALNLEGNYGIGFHGTPNLDLFDKGTGKIKNLGGFYFSGDAGVPSVYAMNGWVLEFLVDKKKIEVDKTWGTIFTTQPEIVVVKAYEPNKTPRVSMLTKLAAAKESYMNPERTNDIINRLDLITSGGTKQN